MRRSLGGSRRDLLFFCYNEATRALTTNLNLNSEVVRACVRGVRLRERRI